MNASRKLSYLVAMNSYKILRHSIHTSASANVASSQSELLSEKLIKPSTPTPPHLKSYKLSHLDQLTTGTYSAMAIFYPKTCFTRDTNNQISHVLEKSLSETLANYYPFAGRLAGNIAVECNDGGASFSEVRINRPMSDIMAKPDANAEDLLFPSGSRWGYDKQDCLMYIQLSHFECGGKAIGLSTSHKICDGCTFTNFLNDWASITRGLKPDLPHLNGASLLPPVNDLPHSPSLELPKEPVMNKRYLFNADSMSRLKAHVAADSKVKNPSRVEVITALLYKCAMAATTTSSAGIFKPSNMLHVVNLRQVTTPTIPPKTFGNFYYYWDISIANEEQMNISRLVNELRSKKQEFFERCRGLKPSELSSVALESDEKTKLFPEHDIYLSSSFLGFPWWMDFGWGKPVKAIFPSVDSKNVLFQMENYDGVGVQVQVTLDDKVMPIFEKEEEILAFASDQSS
ncbi:hypothetical protein LIER_09809 [Lithospermum erythrorhizon]|uniref:Uncharacterized protein n=1 Tax=Lithospermum erythrorhizon TaxID=34254 RepID=A0AAV3PLC0_LITER